MRIRAARRIIVKGIVAFAIFAFLAALGIAYYPALRAQFLSRAAPISEDPSATAGVRLAPGRRDAIRLDRRLARELGIQTAVVQPASEALSLELSGTLILDPDRLSHVHARFAGEVVEFGPTSDVADQRAIPVATGKPGGRGLDFGDPVSKGQLLAVIWSRELGEKKSELVDALSQLRVDEETLAQLTKAAADGAVPDRTVRDAQRKVETDRIAEARIVRTLETWRVSSAEIEGLRAEAARLVGSKSPSTTREELVHQWARLEVRSPLDGVILEKNIALNDLVDTNLDLFKIGDLARLRVMAHVYEEDLPALDRVAQSQRTWTVHVGTGPERQSRPGQFDQIGRIVDPNQHTAMVMGWVDNADGRLRVGQFVTAIVDLSPPGDEVAVPATAVLEQEARQLLFLRSDGEDSYVEWPVALARRCGRNALIRTDLTAAQRRRGLRPLRVGDRVVSSGVVQLKSLLDDLRSESPTAHK